MIANPISALCLNSENKDIDNTFVEALEAIIFLSRNNLNEYINSEHECLILVKSNQKIENTEWFRKIVLSKNNAKDFRNSYQRQFKYEEKYHIGDFLIRKLSQNLRRLYSAHRNGGAFSKPLSNNIPCLKEQQKQIYVALELVLQHLNLNSKRKVFDNIFLGKTRLLNSREALFYLSTHEHIFAENEQIHLNILNKMNSIDISTDTLEDLAIISYPKSKEPFVQKIINHLPDNFFTTTTLKVQENPLIGGDFLTDILIKCLESNISSNIGEKTAIVKNILNNKGKIQKPLDQSEEVTQKMKTIVNNLGYDEEFLQVIIKTVENPNCATLIALNFLDKIDNHHLFYWIINSETHHPIHNQILEKYDLSDQNLLLLTCEKIFTLGSEQKKGAMKNFMGLFGDKLTDETLAQIIASDFILFEDLKPFFLSRKINSNLSTKNPKSNNTNKKFKL